MNKLPFYGIGNLTDDPELRFTPSGQAVAKFRIAHNPRMLDRTTNEWKDGEPTFLPCTVWRQQAENAAESFKRGDRVIVVGTIAARTYETREGEKRTVFEVEVDEIGPSVLYATAKVTKAARGGGTGGGNGRGDEWGGASAARPAGGPPANADQQRAAQQADPAASASPW